MRSLSFLIVVDKFTNPGYAAY